MSRSMFDSPTAAEAQFRRTMARVTEAAVTKGLEEDVLAALHDALEATPEVPAPDDKASGDEPDQ